jgi:hypothetical protein
MIRAYERCDRLYVVTVDRGDELVESLGGFSCLRQI